MRKLIIPVLGLALIAGPAWAWTEVTGSINSLDPKHRELVLDNGQTYVVQPHVQLSSLTAGDTVTLSTEAKGKRNIVNKVTKTG